MGYLLDSVFSQKDKLYIGVDCLRTIQRKYLFSTNFSTGIEIQITILFENKLFVQLKRSKNIKLPTPFERAYQKCINAYLQNDQV